MPKKWTLQGLEPKAREHWDEIDRKTLGETVFGNTDTGEVKQFKPSEAPNEADGIWIYIPDGRPRQPLPSGFDPSTDPVQVVRSIYEERAHRNRAAQIAAGNLNGAPPLPLRIEGDAPAPEPRPTPDSLQGVEAVAEIGRVVPLAGRSGSRVSAQATLTVVPANWDAERAEYVRRLDQLDEAVRLLRPIAEAYERSVQEHGQVGRNEPFEYIDQPVAAIDDILRADASMRIQLSVEQPDFQLIRVCASLLKRAAGALFRWVANLSQSFIQEYVKAAGKKAGELTVTAAVVYDLLDRAKVDVHDMVSWVEKTLTTVGVR